MFLELREYANEYVDCLVPRKHEKLGRWVVSGLACLGFGNGVIPAP